jgi:hypothetical protein
MHADFRVCDLAARWKQDTIPRQKCAKLYPHGEMRWRVAAMSLKFMENI